MDQKVQKRDFARPIARGRTLDIFADNRKVPPPMIDIERLRHRLGMSQARSFACWPVAGAARKSDSCANELATLSPVKDAGGNDYAPPSVVASTLANVQEEDP
jgi:hypothetical protein